MVKKILSLASFILFMLSAHLNAQILTPYKGKVLQDNILRPCLVVNVGPEPKTLKKAWVKFLKKNYDLKLRGIGLFSNSDLLYAKEVQVENISPKKMNFYTYIIEDSVGSEMSVFASLGYDIYLNEEEYIVEFNAMNDMLSSFLKVYLPEYYTDRINESEKRVNNLKKEIKGLKEDIENNLEKIEKRNNEITKMRAEIVDNTQKLSIAEKKLKGRQDKLEKVKIKLQKL